MSPFLRLVLSFAAVAAGSAVTDTHAGEPRKPVVNSVGMSFVPIHPGKFLMGSPEDELGRHNGIFRSWAEIPGWERQHEVTIEQGYYLGVYEVTQEQYQRVVGKNPSFFQDGIRREAKGKDTRNWPVEGVSWSDAMAFCKKLSDLPAEQKAGRAYRLPTEAEWEYACRAGTTTPFYTGNTLSSKQANIDGRFILTCWPQAWLKYLHLRPVPWKWQRPGNKGYANAPAFWDAKKGVLVFRGDDGIFGCWHGPYWDGKGFGKWLDHPVPVGSYKPNPWGLHDMHGNVHEYCADPIYKKAHPYSTPEFIGYKHIFKGGSYAHAPIHCRSAKRSEGIDPEKRNTAWIGFRVVMERYEPDK